MLDAMFQWNVPGMHNMRQIGYSNREGKKTMEIVKKDHGFSYSKNMTNCEGFHWIISWSINLLFLKRAAHSHLLLSNLIWRRKDIYWSIDILNIDKTVPMHLLSIYSLYYKHIFYIYRYITKYIIYNTINKVTRNEIWKTFVDFHFPKTWKLFPKSDDIILI